MDEREAAPAFRRDLQERQGHGLAPCRGVAAGGAGFVQAADDVPGPLIDRLPALVLFDPPLLVLPQEQRQRLRAGQHHKFRRNRPRQVPPQLQGILFSPAIGIAVPFALSEDLPEPAQIVCHTPQYGAFPHRVQHLPVDGAFLHIAGIVAPRGDHILCLPGLFRCGGHSLRHQHSHRFLVSGGVGVNFLADGLNLPPLSLCGVGGLHDCSLQRLVALLAFPHPLQQRGKLLFRLFFRGLQFFQRVDCALFTAEPGEQTVQLAGVLGDKLRGRFIGGQLPALADRLERGIILVFKNVVQDRRVKPPRRCGQRIGILPPGHQGIEGLVDVPGQGGEGGQLLRGRLFDLIQVRIAVP